MADRILSVVNLNVSFGTRAVIRNLSFALCAGDCLAVIGPNGAGKTVLLKALLRLIPYQGEIQWSPEARVGYVPQKVVADRQVPLKAQDLLLAKTRVLKLSSSEMLSVSSEVGLTPELLDTPIGSLSGGQFQKILIAFALLGRPNALLFDEPTASLDELAEERVYELLHSLQTQRRITLVLVSHELSLVYRYATTVLCLSGANPCMGTPKEILTPAMLEELYGTVPKYYPHAHDHQKD
jgi:zinc transport system ATP-binding protein